MGIIYDNKSNIFHLQSEGMSYIIQILNTGHLAHLYWGKKIRESNLSYKLHFKNRSFSPNPFPEDDTFSLDTLPLEYPAYGNSDFHQPAFQIQHGDGSTISDFRYSSHKINKGKPKLNGLPSTYVENDDEAETLKIELTDSLSGISITLLYTIYVKLNVITRSVNFCNTGSQAVKILSALSVSVDFEDSDYDMLQLPGAWARERHIERRPLYSGMQSVQSTRGASSHQQNPFIALMKRNADEDNGDVYGFNLVYSGNFLAQAEVDQYKTTRVTMGINPFDFSWLLQPGENFQTPEAVLVYAEGLGNMSRTYHELYRTRLCRGVYRDKIRPILINNWEATYFDFNEEKILNIAKAGKELGIEMFVLDDGWFGKRNSDRCSLGDWFINKEKLPNSLTGLAKQINDMDMLFGLWFEPEMISKDSELYRAHPDWCLQVDARGKSEGRHQLVLDLSRSEICDAVIKMVSDILSKVPISYVKWDMNRHMTEIGSACLPLERQRETAYRYMLGLYKIMEEITSSFPDILFEGCSGGGGRFDPGMLYYMPQFWASDNTDAIERLKIQYGTSMVYPPCTMGSHVSAVPNHQTGRITPLKIRGDAAMSGNFGYELDLSKLSDIDKAEIKEQVEFYKEIRPLIQSGDFYRLRSPFESNNAAWMFVSKDKTDVMVAYFRILSQPNSPNESLKLKGLCPEMDYMLADTQEVFGGDELMYAGLNVPDMPGDFQSKIWRFRCKN